MKSSLDVSPDLSRYIAKVHKRPTLSREEEFELAVRVRETHDPDATRRLVEANMRHVVAIALSYRRYGLRVAELISEGNVGLMMALHKFDPHRGNRFVTYAAHWIRAFILDYVLRAWSIVGVGSGPLRSKVFFRLRREKARISALTSDAEEVTAQLATRFGTTTEKIAALAQRVEARDLSLDVRTHDDGTAAVVDAIASPAPTQEERFLAYEESTAIRARVRSALDNLDPRERYIMTVRAMADDPEELSLAEIGRRLGVSRERARQIESRAKAKLRRLLEDDPPQEAALHEGRTNGEAA